MPRKRGRLIGHLTGTEAVARGLVIGACETSVRPASVDLTIGEIYVNGKRHESDLALGPASLVVLVSRETVSIPSGYVGYAVPKTSVTQEGLLLLNTGLVDPGYRNHLSTMAINFSKREVMLRRKDRFLRLFFHGLVGNGRTRTDDSVTAANLSAEDYKQRRAGDSVLYPATFLDVPHQIDQISDRLLGRFLRHTAFLLAFVAFFVAVFALFIAVITQVTPSAVSVRIKDATGIVLPRQKPAPQRSATDPGAQQEERGSSGESGRR